MKVHMYALLLLMGLLTMGCSVMIDKPTTVILQNKETMEFVNCEVDHWNTVKSYEANDACVEEYKKQGYVVWGSK